MSATKLFIRDEDITLIDKSAAMSPGFIALVSENQEFLQREGCFMYMHRSVKQDLQEDLRYNIGDAYKIRQCFDLIDSYVNNGFIKLFGNPLEPYTTAQQYLQYIINKRNRCKITMISNDADLIHDIKLQEGLLSFPGYPIKIFTVDDEGILHSYESKKVTRYNNVVINNPQNVVPVSKIVSKIIDKKEDKIVARIINPEEWNSIFGE